MPVPGDFSSAAFFLVAALIVPGSEVEPARGRHQPRPDRPAFHPLPHGRRDGWRPRSTDGPMTVRGDPRARPEPIAPLQRAVRGPLRDRRSRPRTSRRRSTSCRWSPCSAASPRGRPWSAAPAELRAKESDRIAGIVEGLAGLGRRDRGQAGRLRGPRHGRAARGRRSTRAAIIAWRWSARSPGSPPREGVEVDGFESVEVSYPGFERDLRSLLRLDYSPVARSRTSSGWEGCPSPGQGESTSRMPGVLDRLHLVALRRIEDREQARAAGGPLAVRAC